MSLHVGGNGRFADPQAQTEFLDHLQTHCYQVCAIMRDYAGEWYSKANFQGGIDWEKTKRFVNHCLKKLQAEATRRESDE